MDQSLEVSDIKNEPTESTSSDLLEIPTEMQENPVKRERDCLIHTEFDIKTETQEDESEFLVMTSISYETYHYDDIKFQTEEPLIKIEYADLEKEIIQDPLDVGSEIKGEEHYSIYLDQGESRIKIEPTEEKKDENISETNKGDLHATKSNQGQEQLLIRNDLDRIDKKYMCDVCNKAFTQKGSLKRHLLVHTGAKSFFCQVCEKSFNLKHNLDTHMLIHSGEKPHVCDLCKKVFSLKSHLNQHKFIHSGVKSFSCKECNKSFAHKINLVLHKRTHTGEKPFACDLCKKAFAHKSHLTQHKRTHTGEKPYSCNICNKSFAQTSILNRHKKIHKN